MTDHKALQKIRALELQYSEAKQNFEKWKKDNANLTETDAYKNYVKTFTEWEKGVQDQLKEFRTSVAKQPVSPLPAQVPTADLDTQLREALEKVDKNSFVMAIFKMAERDPSFIPAMFQAYFRETSAAPRPSAVPVVTAPVAARPMYTPQPAAQYTYGYGSPSTSMVQQSIYTQQKMSASPHTHSGIRMPVTAGPQPYAQLTPYGAIPRDWTLDEPVKKPMRPPSPIRSYEPSPMPFRDFSQK